MWSSSRSVHKRQAEHDPWAFARERADDLLSGRISGQQFLAAIHLIGHEGPEELQDLVELDDEYLFGNDPGAEENFRTKGVMELLLQRARTLLQEREQGSPDRCPRGRSCTFGQFSNRSEHARDDTHVGSGQCGPGATSRPVGRAPPQASRDGAGRRGARWP